MSSESSVKVAVRVRPMAAKELLANSGVCVEIIPGTQQITIGGGPGNGVGTDSVYSFTKKSFTFDYSFDENSSQDDIYYRSVQPLVDRFLEGFNATILAYGQTGSGKTYSMGIGLDGSNPLFNVSNKGIVPRAISELFQKLSLSSEDKSIGSEAIVTVSFLELYNEEVVDLLNPKPRSSQNSPTIREDGFGKIIWVNLSEEVVASSEELMKYEVLTSVLQRGTTCRTTASTDMNATSSRSHAIFTVTLKQTKISDKLGKTTLKSNFHFVDLAGSERLKRTNAEGDRKKEGIAINQGLLALGNVISALGDEHRRNGHIPYRDSKLTRMLQDSLGGNSQTLMLACVSPSDMNYGETVNTLHYANRARNIKNMVAVNQDWGVGISGDTQREIKSLRSTISKLRTELAVIRASGIITVNSDMIDIGESTNVTQMQYHQRRERDQVSEIEALKKQLSGQSFQLDQHHFTATRLIAKLKEVMKQNEDVTIERDFAIMEKCRLLKDRANIDVSASLESYAILTEKKKFRTTRDNSPEQIILSPGMPKRLRSPSPQKSAEFDNDRIKTLIRDQVSEIFGLRTKLSQCEDRLAWQYEAMLQLGKKGIHNRSTWPEQAIADLNVCSIPIDRSMNELMLNDDLTKNIHNQKQVLEAIRENLQVRKLHDTPIIVDIDAPYEKTRDNTSGSNLKNEISGLFQSESIDSKTCTGIQNESDLFLLINSIQNDIERHQNLMESNQKREADYEKMQKAYESKLRVLHNQMSQFQKERDIALQKIGDGSKKFRADATNKYDEAKRKIDHEISDTKRKLGENSRMQSTYRARAEKLTKELHSTINSLKAEKSKMLKELRTQTQKHRDSSTANLRKISQLRRKEKNSSDAVRKLERSNHLQRLMIKKRNDDIIQSQNSLKQIMKSLKRAATPNKIIKTQSSSGYTSPVSARNRSRNPSHINEILASVNSPVRMSVAQGVTHQIAHDIDIQAHFKKQMVDKELAVTIAYRKTQKSLERLQMCRNNMIEEQKELIAERERVVRAHQQETGINDENAPQYMDERVQSIDVEVASIDNSMLSLEDTLNEQHHESSAVGFNTVVDLSWDNAVNLVRSLDRVELEVMITYFLEDVVNLRSVEEEYLNDFESKDIMIEALQQKLFYAQEALASRITESKRSVKSYKKVVGAAETLDLGLRSPQKVASELMSVHTFSPDTDLVMELGTDNLPTQDNVTLNLNNQSNVAVISIASDQSLNSRADDEIIAKSSVNVQQLPRVISNEIYSEPVDSEATIDPSTLEQEIRPKKRFDFLTTMGGATDVFRRLANSHTQASQAKVIQRNLVDKDATLHDLNAPNNSVESKRKSLTELEHAWNLDS